MARFVTLYSGSSGNSSLVTDGATSLLVDMGCSCKRTLEALYSLGYAARDLRGILITHEHSDHISGLMTFLKHYHLPVYGSFATLCYLKSNDLVPPRANLITVSTGEEFAVGTISARAFPTSHDSVDCVGYRFRFADGKRIAVATDLGYVSDDVLAELTGCELVGLESNYEDDLLLTGRYPYYLKSRIRSISGHLSNAECALTTARLIQSGTKRVVLMHLSQENNMPELALTGCLSALENCGLADSGAVVSVAPRHCAGEPIEI